MFLQVKDPNAPLLAPGLVTGKVQVTNGHSAEDENLEFSRSTNLTSSDFKRVEENNNNFSSFSSSFTSSSNNKVNGNSYKTPPSTLPKPKMKSKPLNGTSRSREGSPILARYTF